MEHSWPFRLFCVSFALLCDLSEPRYRPGVIIPTLLPTSFQPQGAPDSVTAEPTKQQASASSVLDTENVFAGQFLSFSYHDGRVFAKTRGGSHPLDSVSTKKYAAMTTTDAFALHNFAVNLGYNISSCQSSARGHRTVTYWSLEEVGTSTRKPKAA